MKKYQLVILGGAFEFLHKGHISLLEKAFSISEEVLIGIDSDKFCRDHRKKTTQNESERTNSLISHLKKNNLLNRARIHLHEDSNCPATTEKKLQAIIVSEETIEGAQKVNEERIKNQLKELKVVILPLLKAEDGIRISATRIRNGEINRDGRLYIKSSWENKILILPDNLRQELTKPFGKILSSIPQNIIEAETVCVGDVTSRKFNEKNAGQFLSIVDFKVQRKKEFEQLEGLGFPENVKSVRVPNEHGEISPLLFRAVINAFSESSSHVILVDGEEDLSVMPVVLCCPLGFKIFYGQPSEGLVEVLVTEEIKNKVFDLVNRFDVR